MAPEMAWPEICATVLVATICIDRSLLLSAGTFTIWASAADADPENPGPALYVAVMLCVPTESDAVVSVATPPLRATVPNTMPPSLKVIVPDGEPPLLATDALNATACPDWLGFGDDVRVTDVLALV
ncbi:hypothetical protein GCM10007858_38350 [Bradyrhizobium liaoningense]|nr:hypothetical protein GCM10007858_38350 [Bradyrhizobium liaoningense]